MIQLFNVFKQVKLFPMKRDTLFNVKHVQEDFSFNDQVAEVFDDMLCRSVPFYGAVVDGTIGLLERFCAPGAKVYDLGCSTGNLLLEIARRLPDLNLHLTGVDNASAMLNKARKKAEMFSKSELVCFQEQDITNFDCSDADVIICNYTLQFIRPMVRADFLFRLQKFLRPGGLLIVSEKVISPESRLNREFISMYHQFKRDCGYSELEISAKREALENVLIPFSISENKELLQQAGFSEVATFFQWFNFCSFVAMK